MFQALFKRAESAIEQSVTQLLVKLLVAVPFLVALGFAIAALANRLTVEFGSEKANLLLAGLFAALGLVMSIAVAVRRSASSRPTAKAAPPPDEAESASSNTSSSPMSDADRELLFSALTAVAPIALPQLARVVLRNLPLLAAIAAAGFIMTRPTPAPPASQPAE